MATPHAVAALFAGIGGIELGLSRSHHHAVLTCEIDPAAQAVLKDRFPGVEHHDDVTTLRALPRETTLVTAGFPCQDLSQAGRTAGIGGSRSGLVSHVFRLLAKRRTPWVLIENVPFMLRLQQGRAFEYVVSELERLGYRWAYRVVDARSFGAPQRRERVYVLAALDEDPRDVLLADDAGEVDQPKPHGRQAFGFYWTEGIRGLGWAVDSVPTLKGGSTIGIASPPAILMPDGTVIKPDIRDAERLQGFPADWTLPAEAVAKRGARWKLVGNAVSADVAEWIGSRLLSPKPYAAEGDSELSPGAAWPAAGWSLGRGRFAARVGKRPIILPSVPLVDFLQFPGEPLSARATRGFLSRARRSTLRFPAGFLGALERHLLRMEATDKSVVLRGVD